MTRWKLALVAAITLAAGSALALAAAQGRGGHRPVDFDRLAQKLGLTSDQVERLQRIEDGKTERMIEVQAKIAHARHELRKLWRQDSPDRAAILAKVDEVAALEAEKHKVMASARLDRLALITPEQRQELRKLMAERKAAWQARRGEWRHQRSGWRQERPEAGASPDAPAPGPDRPRPLDPPEEF